MAKPFGEERHIAIVGGGIAGLTAAATLAQQGKKITVFEAAPNLGGRARGIQYQQQTLDNGQHILLGAYHETLKLLDLVGVDMEQHLMRLPLSLSVKDLKQSNTFKLTANPAFAAPLHLLFGLLHAQGVKLKDKLAAIRLLAWVRLNRFKLKQDQNLLSFLHAHRQTDRFIRYLWEPLCLAALNTPLASASTQVFLNVLRDSFSKHKQDADLILSRTDLSSLISQPIADYLIRYGSNIHTKTAIQAIQAVSNGYQLQFREQTKTFSHVILAVGPHQLKRFHHLPALAQSTQHFTYQPITTVYLQYPENTQLPQAMMGVSNSQSQWIFDRGQLCQQDSLIAVVISAHATFTQSKNELADQIHQELLQLFPDLARPLWHQVITEKRATFSCDTGLNRPDNQTIYPQLYLAGDYTQGDYPATIEGAVRSGLKAARYIP